MTHDRDGWPEPRLINGIYRVVDDGPPYADMEQRVPEAWDDEGQWPECLSYLNSGDGHNDGCSRLAAEPRGSFRRGLLFGCGTELAALLLVLALALIFGHVATLPPYTGGSNETTRFPGLAGRTRDALGASSPVPAGASGTGTERSDGGAPLGVVPGIGAGDALDQSAVAPVPAPVSLVEPPLASLVATLRGFATYYVDPRKSGLYAAAGPVLRLALGSSWRGKSVMVCAVSCVTVKLSDWCGCGPRHGTPTLVDLSPAAFSRLAPLSAGIVRVSIDVGGRPVPTAPPTDVQ